MTQRLGLSPIVGYLLAGTLVGPHTPGFVADAALAEQLAEIGVILLMFGVGLQFHIEELLAVRRVAVPGAVAQSAVATVLGALACAGVWLGLVGRSDLRHGAGRGQHVVLVRVLADNNDLHTQAGHIAVGWLVVEDLFTVVALVLLPALFGTATTDTPLWLALGLTAVKVTALVAFTAIVGTRVIPRVLDYVAAHAVARALHADGPGDCARHRRRFVTDLQRVDGAWRVSRRDGRGTVRLQPAGRIRGTAHARRVRGAVLRVRRHAAGPGRVARRRQVW